MDFGVGLLSGEKCGCGVAGFVGVVFDVVCVQLLVWKAGLSGTEAVSMFMGILVGETNLERQSVCMFLSPLRKIHMVAASLSNLHLLASHLKSVDICS